VVNVETSNESEVARGSPVGSDTEPYVPVKLYIFA
jgi:hypothetical protein